jgi:hypothetical protein
VQNERGDSGQVDKPEVMVWSGVLENFYIARNSVTAPAAMRRSTQILLCFGSKRADSADV